MLPAAVCNAPDISGERELWSGTVTVKTATVFQGYASESASNITDGPHGNLSDTGTFNLPNTDVSQETLAVHGLYLNVYGGFFPGVSDALLIEFHPDLPLAPGSHTDDPFIHKRLVLYVCDYRVVIWKPGVTGENSDASAAISYSKFSYLYTGSDWSTYSTRQVRLTWDENQSPTFVSAKLDGTSLEVTFSEPLDESKVPADSAFTVTAGGSTVALSSTVTLTVSGNTVTLTLASAPAATATVTVDYDKPSSNALADRSGSEVASFPSPKSVTTEEPPIQPPGPSASDGPAVSIGAPWTSRISPMGAAPPPIWCS